MRHLAIALTLLSVACAGERADQPSTEVRTFDTYPASEESIPRLEGMRGVLNYRVGCLFLLANGEKTALVMPSPYRLDGNRLVSPLRTVELGDWVSFSGGWGPRPADSACRTSGDQSFYPDYLREPIAPRPG